MLKSVTPAGQGFTLLVFCVSCALVSRPVGLPEPIVKLDKFTR